jgi:17beta-estradiol 17-dehydrogenase / very-long-chain 3-oxoacyl-CoA reductase
VNTTRIIHIVLPGMLKRKKSAIINIGSGTTLIYSSPLYIVYDVTKAYVDQFSSHFMWNTRKVDSLCNTRIMIEDKQLQVPRRQGFKRRPIVGNTKR